MGKAMYKMQKELWTFNKLGDILIISIQRINKFLNKINEYIININEDLNMNVFSEEIIKWKWFKL